MKLEDMAKKYNRPIEEFQYRLGGRIEWVCEHGIGHTVWFPKGSDGIHGCDSCCFILDKKQVKGFEKYYISKDGKLYNSEIRRFMKHQISDGYHYVQLNYKGKRKGKSIHRLVAEAYIPNPDNKRCINHKDFNRSNNDIDNLEWVTDSENQQYSYDHDRRPNQKIIANANSKKARKLNENDIKNVFDMKYNNHKIKDIAIKYGVHKDIISRIVRGITYKEYTEKYLRLYKS